MDVILLERIGKLGNLGQVVKVKAGFGRNYLLPQGKALRANKANMDAFEARRMGLETQNANARSAAEALGAQVNDAIATVIRAASDAGSLYGSVSNRDISEALETLGHKVDRSTITLDKAIKELGVHPVRVILHPEVIVNIKVNVARSIEEAALQLEGKSARSLAEDAEAEAEKELAEMLNEVGAASADFKGDLGR